VIGNREPVIGYRCSVIAAVGNVRSPQLAKPGAGGLFIHFSFQKGGQPFPLPITDHRLPITDYRLLITDYWLPVPCGDGRTKSPCHFSIKRRRPESKSHAFISSPENQRSSLLSELV
jgi:hypothetical protein